MAHESDLIELGASVRLLPLPALASMFGINQQSVMGFLGHLNGVRVLNGPNGVQYVSMFHLEEALFNLFEHPLDPKELRVARRELAGVLYGGLSYEMLRTRVREIAKYFGKVNRRPSKPKEPTKRVAWGRPRKDELLEKITEGASNPEESVVQ